MNSPVLIACDHCDLLHRHKPLTANSVARCRRCDGVLYRYKPNSLERTLALAVAAGILFVIANSFPFLSFSYGGHIADSTLIESVIALLRDGRPVVAVVVFVTTVLAPALHLSALLYVTLPVRARRPPRYLTQAYRLLNIVKPWGMMEIFMLGILVSVVKLAALADIVVGTGLWAFAGLIVVLAATSASFDEEAMWERLGTQQ